MSEQKKIKVTLIKSLRGLGLRRMNHTVEVLDTPENRGMITRVAYLVKCEA
jgi:large subunit ribosomal protein L30